jgi:cytochrome c-type biogenesis protein CcmH/NrfG
MPLPAATSIHSSQAAARFGNLSRALTDARGVEGFASLPRLQEAVVLEAEGSLGAAAAAARAAARREPEQWRAWVIRSRIAAEQGQAQESPSAYRRARTLNPNSPLFE